MPKCNFYGIFYDGTAGIARPAFFTEHTKGQVNAIKTKSAENQLIFGTLLPLKKRFVGVAACHVSLQMIDFQHFNRTYLNQIPLWTLDLQVTSERIDYVLFTA